MAVSLRMIRSLLAIQAVDVSETPPHQVAFVGVSRGVQEALIFAVTGIESSWSWALSAAPVEGPAAMNPGRLCQGTGCRTGRSHRGDLYMISFLLGLSLPSSELLTHEAFNLSICEW